MATKTWASTGDQTWADNGNWAEGSYPASSNDVIINAAGVPIDGSNQAAVDLASLYIGRSYDQTIGSGAAYLIIGSAAVSIYSGTAGKHIYLDSGGTYGLDAISIDSNADAADQTIYLKGTIGTLIVNHGNIKIVSGTVTNLYIEWDGTGTAPTIELDGATVTSWWQNTAATSFMSGSGTVTNLYNDAGTFSADNGTVTNVFVRGGTYTHKTNATLTLGDVFDGGTFDGSEDARSKTITTLRRHAGSSVDLNNGMPGSFTIGTETILGNGTYSITT